MSETPFTVVEFLMLKMGIELAVSLPESQLICSSVPVWSSRLEVVVYLSNDL